MSTLKAKSRYHTWPLLLLCLPAFVAVWGGWVGIGEKTGFGVINMLPGMVEDGGWATVNTAVTLPIGLETYAAFALHTALGAVTQTLRRFSFWSAVSALTLGALGQLAFHLMESRNVTHAPWPVTALVAMIPVAVLGAGTALASLIKREQRETEAEQPLAPATETTPVETAIEPAIELVAEPAVAVTAPSSTPRAARMPAVRATPEDMRKAVKALLDGATVKAALTLAGLPDSKRAAVGRYSTAVNRLRNDPQADVSNIPGLHPELLAEINDWANRERVR